jgi:hypothetical protein
VDGSGAAIRQWPIALEHVYNFDTGPPNKLESKIQKN